MVHAVHVTLIQDAVAGIKVLSVLFGNVVKTDTAEKDVLGKLAFAGEFGEAPCRSGGLNSFETCGPGR
jgi:hypothetical protein